MNICFCKFLIKSWCASKCQKMLDMLALFLWVPAAVQHIPCPLLPWNHTLYYLVILLLSQRYKKWTLVYCQSIRENCGSPRSTSCRSPFSKLFHLFSSQRWPWKPETTWTDWDGGKQPRSWSQLDKRQKARVLLNGDRCMMAVLHIHAPTYSEKKKSWIKSPSPLSSPWPLSIPLQADRARMWETMKDSPSYFTAALKYIFIWQDR